MSRGSAESIQIVYSRFAVCWKSLPKPPLGALYGIPPRQKRSSGMWTTSELPVTRVPSKCRINLSNHMQVFPPLIRNLLKLLELRYV